MSYDFKMDAAQPRLLDETVQGLIGRPMPRPEGMLKVTGRALYAGDDLPAQCAHGVLVRATITKGRITRIDDAAVRAIPGVLAVLHGPRLVRNPAQGRAGEAPEQPDARVDYHGQPVACVIAETFEAARDAAAHLVIDYDAEAAEVDPSTASELERDDPETAGDWDTTWAAADARVDVTFDTPGQAAAAMEPHAAIAEWSDGKLTLHASLQMLAHNRAEIADAVGVDVSQVRILSPYVGGGFGSKLGIGPESVAAALAAREIGRPVRIVMPRQTVFDSVLRRAETTQHLRLAATSDGTFTCLAHDNRVSNLPGEGFSEPVANASKFTYAAAALHFADTVARIHRTPSGSVRAPGEAVGMLALEVAVDMLAERVGMDPLAFRLANVASTHPLDGTPIDHARLADCLREGADRFGWAGAAPHDDGSWRIGYGMASAARKNLLVDAAARVRLTGKGAVVETDMTDIGTGTYSVLAQIAGEMLGVAANDVEVRLADTDLPEGSGSGGSFGANSTGSAVFLAARKIRETVAAKLGCDPSDLTLQDGIARGANKEARLTDLLDGEISEEASISKGDAGKSHFSAGYGAHFCEVAVHRWTGEVRVRRMLGVFDIGRVLSARTARAQAIGGMIWGLSGALTEELSHDPRTGHVVTRDLANYHVASHADVPRDMDVTFLENRDDHANPLQSKGVGELGISGSGGAILNAIHNACGARLLQIPATPDRLIAAL